MGRNLITAIINIAIFGVTDFKKYSSTYLNRINAVGEQLEFYVKDSLSSSFKKSHAEKEKEYSNIFAYLGNQNNPPDIILKQGDAFEIKKIESPNSVLALNSSPPKDRLHSTDPRITRSCKECDGGDWKEKDLFYVIGHVRDGMLKYILFIHGLCYAADKSVYERVHQPLKEEISSILTEIGLEIGSTIELGKIKRVDPLGITELRVRGMWSIQNPLRAFPNVFHYDKNKEFSLFALVKKEKYDLFPKDDIKLIEETKAIKVKDVKIKDPNNPAELMNAKLIELGW
jgi:hypothetical protein